MKHLHLILLLLVLSSGCKTLEEKCAERFPSETRDSIIKRTITDTLILPWHTVEYVDSTECPPSDTPHTVIKTKYIKLPGDTIEYEVQCIDTIALQHDQAKINYLTQELSKLGRAVSAERQTSRNRSYVIVALSALLALLLFLLIRKD